VKNQAELVDDLRQKVFDLLDQMARKRQELNDQFVHVSVCSQLQQATRDTQVRYTSDDLRID
jgi:gluconate kinase